MASPSIKNITLILIAIVIGASGGYIYQDSNSNEIIQDQMATINNQNEILTHKEEEIQNLLETIQDNNDTITNQQSEIEILQDELENQQNMPNLLTEKENRINELEEELQDNGFEIFALKNRLGERINWQTYDQNDIYFEYPDWMDLSLVKNKYDEGLLLSINYIDPFNYFQYEWLSTETIEEAVSNIKEESEDTEFIQQDLLQTKINGHDAYLYLYNITVGDGWYHGVICAWECPATNRVNLMLQFSDHDPLTTFFQILSTIKCHDDGEAI